MDDTNLARGKDKILISVLGTALMIALCVIAFLLGRQSVGLPPSEHTRTTSPVLSVVVPIESPVAHPPRAPAEYERFDGQLALLPPPSETGRLVESQFPRTAYSTLRLNPVPPNATTQVPRTQPTPNVHDDVVSYLDLVKALSSNGPDGDPKLFAMEVTNAAMSGDLSKFDDVVASIDGAISKIRAVQPPPKASQYHETLLSQLETSRALARDIRNGLADQDMRTLRAASERASRLQGSLELLNRLEADLRAKTP